MKFDAANETHLDFIISAAHLRAYTMGLIASEFKPESIDRAHYAKVASEHNTGDWKPRDNVTIEYDPDKKEEDKVRLSLSLSLSLSQPWQGVSQADEAGIKDTLARLPKASELKGWKMNVLDFEKDDDRNFHIDFIHSASNLRAVAYDIPTVSRLQAKVR